ncbi:MAG: Nif3-like dinuclear metal center hexameric protein [Victivallaceae bacterium]|nr:Nif3-like dinuclear metal center hexameric protein [Victivallaceae bacterium]
MKLTELTAFLDETLQLDRFSGDCSNNGLQVEGAPEIRHALFAVDGCLAVFDAAYANGCDFVFVHHGLSWGAYPKRFTGVAGRRLNALFSHGISLYAAHLPLDAHPTLGNNAELSRLIGLCNLVPYCKYDGVLIGLIGEPGAIVSASTLADKLGKALGVTPTLDFATDRILRKVAVVSGGGGLDALEQAAASGADLLVTGEMTHVMYHVARELDMAVLALGHYASETVGPKAVMREVARRFDGLKCEFFDCPTGL